MVEHGADVADHLGLAIQRELKGVVQKRHELRLAGIECVERLRQRCQIRSRTSTSTSRDI